MDLESCHSTWNLPDIPLGRVIDTRALNAERAAVANWKHDDGSALLREAIKLWRVAKRPDRADALEAMLPDPSE